MPLDLVVVMAMHGVLEDHSMWPLVTMVPWHPSTHVCLGGYV